MSNQAMVADSDPEAGHDVEHREHRPVDPGIIVVIRESRKPDQGAQGDQPKKGDRTIANNRRRTMDLFRCSSISHGESLQVYANNGSLASLSEHGSRILKAT